MNIIRLIAKDLRLQRNFVLPLMLLEVAGCFAYAVQMPSHIPYVAFGLLHGVALIGDFLICYRTMVAEEKNRAFLFVKSLPVSTAEIVIAKFAVNFLLVGLNTGLLLTLWGGGRALGWIGVAPGLTLYLVVGGLTAHWFNNAFFAAVALVFSSERAVWAPFPAIFMAINAIVNFRRIVAALRLEPVVHAFEQHQLLLVVLLWAAIAALVAGSFWAVGRKRVFA